MAITEVISPFPSNLGIIGGTTGSIDTTGCNLLVLSVSYFSSGSPTLTVSDSKSNTWTALTARENVCGHQFYYALSPTVGSGHTFTIGRSNATDIYTALIVHGFAGVSSYDQQSGVTTAGTPSTSLQPGSLTPAANGALIITGLSMNTVSSVGVNSSLTLTEQPDVGGGCVTGATGWKVQSTAAAINPTWSWTNSDQGGTNMAVFLEPGGGGGGGGFNALLIAP